MRVEDLQVEELLEFESDDGIIRFAGHRALLLDAVAMGLLRQYIAENFGLTAARAVFTQFGFAHGWRMAAALRQDLEWASDDEWRRAGPHLCGLQGLFVPQPGSQDPLAPRGANLMASYEAEQHLLHFGRSEFAACWTISGLMSGYLSQASDQEIYVLEDQCVSQGHAACHLRGRSREEWGEDHTDELSFFDAERLEECLDVSLSRVTKSLKQAEQKLRARQRTLTRVLPDLAEPLGLVARSGEMRNVVDLARRWRGSMPPF